MGIGSVCRRHLHGPDGLLVILNKLDRELPAGVRLHLFGVKGDAIRHLRDLPRVQSVDSMAWDLAARREREGSSRIEDRSEAMRRWYLAQEKHLAL